MSSFTSPIASTPSMSNCVVARPPALSNTGVIPATGSREITTPHGCIFAWRGKPSSRAASSNAARHGFSSHASPRDSTPSRAARPMPRAGACGRVSVIRRTWNSDIPSALAMSAKAERP